MATSLGLFCAKRLEEDVHIYIAQLAGAVEFTVCNSAERERHSRNECPGYDTRQSDGEVSVMLELWGMQSAPSLPSLPGPLWPGVIAPDRVLSMGQIELKWVLMLNWITWNRSVLIFKLRIHTKLNCLKWICFWHLNCTYAKLNCLK